SSATDRVKRARFAGIGMRRVLVRLIDALLIRTDERLSPFSGGDYSGTGAAGQRNGFDAGLQSQVPIPCKAAGARLAVACLRVLSHCARLSAGTHLLRLDVDGFKARIVLAADPE